MTDTTPAHELRAAAKKLRATAGNATEGPWAIWRDLDHQGYITVGDATGVITPPALQSSGACNPVAHVYVEEDAEHIALMHPAVGLALADWLEQAAKAHDATIIGAASVWRRPEEATERDAWVAKQTDHAALAVARQVLGTTTGQPETAPAVDRATVLREAADRFEADGRYVQQFYGHQIGTELRRLAAEAQQPTPAP